MTPSRPPSFVADSTLGKLAGYLRLAGFDTLLDPGVPDARRLSALAGADRTVLTRSRAVRRGLGAERVVFIEPDAPPAQMRQVMAALGLRRRDCRPLTRCAACNQPLEALSRDAAAGRVPDHVWRHCDPFQTCRQCGRVYWKGTHARRWLDRMALFFDEER
jgi:uncharacterized protein